MKIEVHNVTKKYRQKKALDAVSFTLSGPKIYGLLGRNGAGKTTFMDILAGHQLATSGEVFIDGEKPFDNRNVLEKICIIKESDNFYKELTTEQIFRTCSFIYPNWDQNLAEQMADSYELPLKKKIKTYSKGMASAVGIIVGIASRAQITIFDEPYIGLDAAARKRFYDILLEQYETEERVVIFSTHLIDEVSLLFEEVLILQEGKLILHEAAETLREKAYSVTGHVEEVTQFIQNKHVIDTKQVANMMTASIFGDRKEAESSGLQVDGIPIQDLMIYLTEKKKGA